MNEYPAAVLDPIRRVHVLAAAVPGAAVTEGVLDAPYDAVWEAATRFDRVSEIEVLIRRSRVRARAPDPGTGGERLEVEYRPRPFGPRGVLEVDLRPGWCWMVSPISVAAMAARPEGEATRFAHLEALRLPGRRLAGPLLGLKMSLVGELGRIEAAARALHDA